MNRQIPQDLKRINRELRAEIERHKATEAALLQSQDEYRGLIERVPVGIYRTTVDGKILEVNSALVRMLGYLSREELLEQTVLSGYVNHEDRVAWRDEIERNGVVRNFELQLYRKDGSKIWVRDSGRAVKDRSGAVQCFEGIMQDITEAKQAREELQNAFSRLRELESVVNRSPAVFFRWANDPGWPVMFVSDNVAQFGYRGSDFVEGKIEWMSVLDPDEAPRLDNLIKHYLRDGVTEFELQFRLRRVHGEFNWVEAHVFVVRNGDGVVKYIEGLIVDIDQRRRLERQIAEIAEHERQRIGRDLHDVLGQSLTGTAFFVKALQNKLAAGEELSLDETNKIAGMIHNAISLTRTLARGLCPVDLEDQGLVCGLKELAVGVEDLYGVHCSFEGPHDVDIGDHDFAVALYYIAQEAVNNAVRHGEPTRIDICLEESQERIELTISDNGSGFDPQTSEPATGMGLSLMRYRAEACGAWFEVRSAPGEGTVARCSR
jgi:two-component system sensor kinase FixL